MWGLFSKDPSKDFPYESGERLGQIHLANKTVWSLHTGKHRTSGDLVTIFSCDTKDGASQTQLDIARAAVKRLKTLRHPSVLTFVHSVETDKAVLLATEPVEPLQEHLEQLLDRGPKRDNYLAWGIFQESPVQILPSCNKYSPPERADPSKARISNSWGADVWGLGCLIWEVYNGALPAMESLGKLGDIAKNLQSTYKECVGANPAKRPNPSDILTRLRKSQGFFKNDLIDIVLFLEELQIKEDADKSRFYSSLPGLLDNCPANVCQNKILPQLINAFEYGNAGSAILTPVFKIGKDLDTAEYQAKIVPCVVKLFSSNDRNARFKLLSQVENFVEHLSNKIVNDQVFPKIESGFLDSEPLIREKTVIALIHLAPKLNYSNLDEIVVMKHFTRLARDEQGGIRTNTTVCLGKIARYLHPKTRQQCLFACFSRSLKDPFPPSRIAGINAIAATQQFYTVAETGARVLPTLAAVTVDPEKSVRDQAFRVVKGFLGKLEKVSEDPELREEMEKEVGSTNSAVVAAAAGWANWAVGAVTAKFYKSPTDGSGGGKEKSATPEASLADNVKKVNLNTETNKPSPAPAVSQRSEGISDGWDDDGDNDGWGDLNEKTDVKNEGWDDNDDWGSLEDNNSSSKQNTAPSRNYDFGGGFNSGTKTHDAFAEIKPASTSDNLMAGPGGWDDWGASSPGGEESKDEARRRREEKRAERQKELEAKRAAKKGPMKLGAKKMND